MRSKVFVILFGVLFLPCGRLWGQGIELGLDWNMGAIVSANDYTNGATDGAPSLTLAFDFQGLAAEIFYKRYKLEQSSTGSLDASELEFEQNIIGLGVRLTHNQFFLSRFGLHYVDIESTALDNDGEELSFDFDGSSVGFYGGAGFQIPLAEGFHFQTIGQLETSREDLTILSLLFGFRYRFTQL